jgi:hypothetical protein
MGSTSAGTMSAGQTYHIKLVMSGNQISFYVNGTKVLGPYTDTTDSNVGTGGFFITNGSSTGFEVANWDIAPVSATPAMTDAKNVNNGTYANSPTFFAPGGIVNDPDGAVTFNGSNQYGQVASPTSLPTGAGTRSVEAWFKTTSSSNQSIFSYGTLGNAQMFGLMLATPTQFLMWNWGGSNDQAVNLAAAVNDGAWHQVVETYNGTGETLYVDGASVGTKTVALNTVMGATGFGIGANIMNGDTYSGKYFNGSVDDVSIYNVALSAATVANHYHVGHGS